MALKTRPRPKHRGILQRIAPHVSKATAVADPAPIDASPKVEANRFTAFGLYKAREGLWILRTLEIRDNQVVGFVDNEPDLRAIQVGKIAMALEGTEEA